MSDSGYTYDDPFDANADEAWMSTDIDMSEEGESGGVASPAEIAAATSTVRCGEEVNWIGVFHHVDTAVQRALIERDALAAQEAQSNLDAIMVKAAEVVQSGGS
ncbi:MAG: hypothetical protein GY722_25715 [bacterium]|nr:hypothetical protein [bacterium]